MSGNNLLRVIKHGARFNPAILERYVRFTDISADMEDVILKVKLFTDTYVMLETAHGTEIKVNKTAIMNQHVAMSTIDRFCVSDIDIINRTGMSISRQYDLKNEPILLDNISFNPDNVGSYIVIATTDDNGIIISTLSGIITEIETDIIHICTGKYNVGGGIGTFSMTIEKLRAKNVFITELVNQSKYIIGKRINGL